MTRTKTSELQNRGETLVKVRGVAFKRLGANQLTEASSGKRLTKVNFHENTAWLYFKISLIHIHCVAQNGSSQTFTFVNFQKSTLPILHVHPAKRPRPTAHKR